MCFSIYWFAKFIIMIAFIGLCFGLLKLWAGEFISAKVVLTVRYIVGFILLCIIVWFLVDVLQCFIVGGYTRLR